MVTEFQFGVNSSFSVRSANRCIKQKQIGIKGSELAADKSWSSGPSRFGMQKKPLCRLLLLAGDRAENAALFRHSWQSVDPVLNYWRWDTTTDLSEPSRRVPSFTGIIRRFSCLLCLFSDKRRAVIVFRGASE